MILLDIETARDPSVPVPDPGQPPASWRDPAKIDRWKRESREKKAAAMALSPHTGRVVVVTASVDDAQPVSFFGPDEGETLREFGAWVASVDAEGGDLHALCAYNGLDFDFPFLAWRAALVGEGELARRASCRSHGDALHVDPYDRRIGGSLAVAAASVGHHHPSPAGGGLVSAWLEAGNIDAIIQHGVDDILALQPVASMAVAAGLIRPQR